MLEGIFISILLRRGRKGMLESAHPQLQNTVRLTSLGPKDRGRTNTIREEQLVPPDCMGGAVGRA